GPGWHFFGRPQSEYYRESLNQGSLNQGSLNQDVRPTLAVRNVASAGGDSSVIPQGSYAKYVTRDVSSVAPVGGPVFILKTGAILAVGNYQYQDGRITYTLSGGGGGVVTADEVDWSTTTRVNTQRGVRMTLHSGHVNTETSGF